MDLATFFQQDWVKNLITLASALAAILAWVAKLRWSKEYSDAKNATIDSKEEQIKAKDEQIQTKQAYIEVVERENNSLREQTPEKLLERYQKIQGHHENMLEQLVKELDSAQEALNTAVNISGKRENIYRNTIAQKESKIRELEARLSEIKLAETSAKNLTNLSKIMAQYDDIDEWADSPDRYTDLPSELTIENLVKWFFENYKDPADGVPWDGEDKEYVYMHGGPYGATEELWTHFPDADDEVIEAAVAEIENDGTIDWVKQWQY